MEETNSRLMLSLLVVLSVLRLRSHSIMVKLSGYRSKAGKSRKALWRELSFVKQALVEYVLCHACTNNISDFALNSACSS